MEHDRPKDEEQLEHHSLPGTNMAGKGPADECEHADHQTKQPDADRREQPTTDRNKS